MLSVIVVSLKSANRGLSVASVVETNQIRFFPLTDFEPFPNLFQGSTDFLGIVLCHGIEPFVRQCRQRGGDFCLCQITDRGKVIDLGNVDGQTAVEQMI